MEPILETNGLTIAFGGHLAVNGVHLQVPQNSFKSIIGPNGAGKTTFFNLLSGQLNPTKGKVIYKGTELHICPLLLEQDWESGDRFKLRTLPQPNRA